MPIKQHFVFNLSETHVVFRLRAIHPRFVTNATIPMLSCIIQGHQLFDLCHCVNRISFGVQVRVLLQLDPTRLRIGCLCGDGKTIDSDHKLDSLPLSRALSHRRQ